jgi:hypothetical protein
MVMMSGWIAADTLDQQYGTGQPSASSATRTESPATMAAV